MRSRVTYILDTAAIKQINKCDLALASGLFIIAIITRIPFASRIIFEGDSARFALALQHYDVTQMRPHAPGYILYVALAKLVDLFVHNPCVSMVGVSIVASAVTIFFLYFLAKKLYGRDNAFTSSLLLLSSPVFWFNGEMPLTYALEGLLSVIFAFSCYEIITGENKWLVVSGILLGLATGVRQNIVIMLLPLWLYAIRKSSLKHILICFSVFGLTCLSWFVPMISLSGGLEKYFSAVNAQFRTWVLHPAPFLWEIIERWKIFSRFMVLSFGLALVPIIYYFGQLFKIPVILEDRRLKFILLWFLPGILFFIGVNVFNSGHVIVILPPLCICLAESVKGLARDLTEGIKWLSTTSHFKLYKFGKITFFCQALLISSLILIMMVNLYVFLFKNTRVSYAAIENADKNLTELIQMTKENFKPDKTIILTFLYNTQAAFYLPDYLIYCPFPLMFSNSQVPIEAQNVYVSFHQQTSPKTFWIHTDFKIEPIEVPDHIDTIVLWEKEIMQYYSYSDRPLQEISANPSGMKIYFFQIKPEEKIIYDYHYLSVR